MVVVKNKDFKVNTAKCVDVSLRGALIEAKESMEGKRKLNTLDNLLDELRKDSKQ